MSVYRTTSNPAFRNLPTGGGYANFNYGNAQGAGYRAGFGQANRSTTAPR